MTINRCTNHKCQEVLPRDAKPGFCPSCQAAFALGMTRTTYVAMGAGAIAGLVKWWIF